MTADDDKQKNPDGDKPLRTSQNIDQKVNTKREIGDAVINRLSFVVEESGSTAIRNVFRNARPIEIFSGDEIPQDKKLGKVTFLVDFSLKSQSLEILHNSASLFEVRYSRRLVETWDYQIRPDDAALIARLFLLSTISKLKSDMRDCLYELNHALSKDEKDEKDKKDTTSEAKDNLASKAFSVVKILGWAVEHWLSYLVKNAIGSFAFLAFLWTTVALVIVGLFYGLLAPIGGYQSLPAVLLWPLKIMLVFLATFFALLALNFKDKEDRAQDQILEKTNKRLGEILSELTQTNANVASSNTHPQAAGYVPELLLRHFDEVLHTKEAVIGLEKVILARQRDVAVQVHHVKEHQERARRAATAAAGGIFTGFFTFEVGERVFKFMHLIHGQDERSMFFWLSTEAQQFSNPDLVNAQERLPLELQETYKNCVQDGGKSCTTVQQTLSPVQIREHFMKQYQHSEMHAYGLLLAITLVVSLIAAAIGWRKPAEEQAGGHGGHH